MISEKKINLFCFPQGIGDFLHALDRLILTYFKNHKDEEYVFILQYRQQKEILNFFIGNNFKYILTSQIKKNIYQNFKTIFFILITKFNLIIIEPNISLNKTKFVKLFTRYNQCFSSIDKKLGFQKKFKVNNYDLIRNFLVPNKEIVFLKNFFTTYNYDDNNFYIGISAGSGKLEKHKRWPKEHFSNLINLICNEKNNVKFILFGSEKEYGLNSSIKDNVFKEFHSKIKIYKNFDIIKNFHEISKMNLFLSNDNGLSHASTLLGVKTFCFFGPTDHRDHGNFLNRNIIKINLSCAPCYHQNRFGCGNEKCLKELKPEFAFRQIKNNLN